MRILLFMKKEYVYPVRYDCFCEKFIDCGGNVGNRVFHRSLYRILNAPYNELSFCEFDDQFCITNYTTEEINSLFDCVIIPCILLDVSTFYLETIKNHTETLEGVTVPIYLFSVGTDMPLHIDMCEAAKIMSKTVCGFAEKIYSTGGKIVTRGYITQELLGKMGIHDVLTYGCQSIYQNGKDFFIVKKEVSEKKFKVAINGNTNFLRRDSIVKMIENNPTCEYFDQDEFRELIYGRKGYARVPQSVEEDINRYTEIGLELFKKSRLRLFGDVEMWIKYLQDSKFSFSVGERVHGTIVALLAGIPSLVLYGSIRVKEMTDYFHIPARLTWEMDEIQASLYELYCNLDYADFNCTYRKNFQAFDNFLKEEGLVNSMEDGLSNELHFQYQDFRIFDRSYRE